MVAGCETLPIRQGPSAQREFLVVRPRPAKPISRGAPAQIISTTADWVGIESKAFSEKDNDKAANKIIQWRVSCPPAGVTSE